MKKSPMKSKTNWVALVGTAVAVMTAIDAAKLPEQWQKWYGVAFGLLVLMARNFGSDIGKEGSQS